MASFNEYETVIIIRPDLDDADTYAIIEKLEGVIGSGEGHLLIRDDWGKKRLAYNIDKHQKGHYVLLNFLSFPELVAELERNIRIEDSILRFLTVQRSTAVDVEVRIQQAAEQRRLREEAEKARAAAAAAGEAYEDDDDYNDEDEDDDLGASA